MVTFRGRSQGKGNGDIEVSISPDSKTVFIGADLKPVSMAVEAFFKSDEAPKVSSHQVSAKFGFEGDRLLRRLFTITQYKDDDDLLDPEMEEENIDSVIRVLCQKDGEGTRITISGEASKGEFDFSGELSTVEGIAESMADFIYVNREKVVLGYGPQHPLENIEPTTITEDEIPNSHKEAIETFRPWMNEVLNRSRVTRNEQAFFNDWGNNTVGVVEGKSNTVPFPHTLVGELNFAAHTHPNIKSAPVPSTGDIQMMTAQRTGTFHCIMRGLYNTYYSPSGRDEQEIQEMIEKGSTAYNTFDKTSVATFEVVSGNRVTDIDSYIKEYFDVVEEIIRKDKVLAVEQIESHSDGLADKIVELSIDRVIDTAEMLMDNVGEGTEGALRGAYEVENQVVVPKYHVFEIEQHDKKPVADF